MTDESDDVFANLDYETAKRIAKDGSFQERQKLAAQRTTAPELLFFLAADTSPSVRQAVAINPATPPAAHRLLAHDAEEPVRISVAESLARLWPDYEVDSRTEVRDTTIQALELLAVDHALKVREALASAIKDVAFAPHSVVTTLARDIAQSVAEPILRQCARLDKDTLIALAATRREQWVPQALARRASVPPQLARAIYETGNAEATRLLLENRNAAIPEDTLSLIVNRAPSESSWHKPLVRRPALPRALSLRLAEFVDIAAFEILRKRSDFDEALTAEIVTVARRRLDWTERYGGGTKGGERAFAAWQDGMLNENSIGDATAWSDRDFVRSGLALLARIDPRQAEKILKSGSAAAVTALVWRAGLSMRAAMQIQKAVAEIPPHKLLHARGGTDYPLPETEMIWHLEFFGCQM